MRKIKIQSPATVANLVCGFDILGMALQEPFDEMELLLTDEPGLTIEHLDPYHLPTDPEKNVAGASLLAFMEALDQPVGIHMKINKLIKPGSGLGSSAASSAGAVVAANELLGKPFDLMQLVQFAMNGEKVASGVKHADNIAPAIYGGITLIRSIFPLDIVPLDGPDLYVTVVHPQIEVKTSDAREILRKQVELKNAIRQWGNIAGLVTGFLKKDTELIGRSLEDVIIEPVRRILIPGFEEVKSGSHEAGALGGGISGSGPSIFMLSTNAATANSIKDCMENVYTRYGIEHKTYVTQINYKGISIVASE